jgi:hypothetical protein
MPKAHVFDKPFYAVKEERKGRGKGKRSRTVIEPLPGIPVKKNALDAALSSCTTKEELAKVLRTRQRSLE